VVSDEQVRDWITDIERLPADLRRVVEPLADDQLDTPYRPDGWTVRQVVHHLADSHMNSCIRFKWALTEDRPAIKPFYEDRWARLADYAETPVPLALDFLHALHQRWVILLRTLTESELDREFFHPEAGENVKLRISIGNYAWHGRHHLAHITRLAEREGWF
jgi:hypothetical protein